MISHEYPPIGGGGANACMNLARQFSTQGHDVDIVTVWFEGLLEEESITEFEQNTHLTGTTNIYRLKSKRKHLDHCSFMEMLDYLRKALSFAKKLLISSSYDVCLIFFGIPSGPIGYFLKKKYKLPYVIRFGGGDIPGFQDRFTQVYKFISPVIKKIWKSADALVANSQGLKELAENFYSKKEILVIPNGADLFDYDSGKESKLESTPNTINLLFVSRLIERKGLQDIIPYMSKVRDYCQSRGKSLILHIVGNGPYKNSLQELVNKNSLQNIVNFHGQKNKSELPAYYKTADIFIFPSRKEGMPNVVLEAMSYGLPILMTPCQGSDELINGNGYIANANEFAEYIIKMLSDQDALIKQSNESLRLVKDVFSWKKSAKAYLRLFDNIIKVGE